MNSNSANDYQWSVKITDGTGIRIGIATKLQRDEGRIEDNDQNAIIFSTSYGTIRKGKKLIHQDISKTEPGNEIHFRFSADSMMISMTIVCFMIFLSFSVQRSLL